MYALIGGLGVSIRGPMRATRDIDFLLTVPQIQLPNLLESLKTAGFELHISDAIEAWNQGHMLQISMGTVKVDWLKPVVPAFQAILDRAKLEEVNGMPIRVADAEGLLLLKLLAFRLRDQDDICGILAANVGRLDIPWVRKQWAPMSSIDESRLGLFDGFVHEYYE